MNVDSNISILIDLSCILSSGIILQSLKYGCTKIVYPFIVQKILHQLDDEKWIDKFIAESWWFTWHLIAFIIELIVLIPTPFWEVIMNPWRTVAPLWLYPDNENDISLGIRILLWSQIGYFAVECFVILFIHRPSEYQLLLIHHIASLILLMLAYLPTFGSPPYAFKIGCAIIFIQEIGAVTLHLSKALYYAEFKLWSSVMFGINTVVWLFTRIVWNVPFIVGFFYGNCMSRWQTIPGLVLWVGLYSMQLYWSYLMIRIVLKAIVNGQNIVIDVKTKDVGKRTSFIENNMTKEKMDATINMQTETQNDGAGKIEIATVPN